MSESIRSTVASKAPLEQSFKAIHTPFCVAFQCVVNEIHNKIETVLSKELHRTSAMNLELLREYSFWAPVPKNNKLKRCNVWVFWVFVVVCIVARSK